jgi:hypothetical protein
LQAFIAFLSLDLVDSLLQKWIDPAKFKRFI